MSKILSDTFPNFYYQAQAIAQQCKAEVTNFYYRVQATAQKYEAEITLAGELTLSATTLLANEIFKLPAAKAAKQNLTLLKSVWLFPLSLTATCDLLTRKAKNVNDVIRNLASMSLIPFTILEVYNFLATKVTILNLSEWSSVNNFFKASPILGHVKYLGIPNVAIIALLATVAFDSYKKGQKLRSERDEMIQKGAPEELLKKHEIKIIQNNWSLAGKVVKVASSVFSLAVAVGGYAHPALTAIKITLLVVDMGVALKKYHTKHLKPDDIFLPLSDKIKLLEIDIGITSKKIKLLAIDMEITSKKCHTKQPKPDDIPLCLPEETVLSDAA